MSRDSKDVTKELLEDHGMPCKRCDNLFLPEHDEHICKWCVDEVELNDDH